MGFMAIRVSNKTALFFETVGQMAMDHGLGRNNVTRPKGTPVGGDQKLVNVALRHPDRLPQLPRITWALFPTELMTRSLDIQRGLMYKHEPAQTLYHVNDFGGPDLSPEKARESKMALLALAELKHEEQRARVADIFKGRGRQPTSWARLPKLVDTLGTAEV